MEAMRAGLHEHKENVEANISRGNVAYDDLSVKARTPSGKLQPYSTPKSMKVTGKSSSTTKKPRRALGDISNQHRTPNAKAANTDVLGKRMKEGKLKSMLKSGTPTSSSKKVVGPVPKTANQNKEGSVHAETEEIEHAYGGLPSYGPDPAYLERIRQEIVRELHEDSTPSIMDNYGVEDKVSNQWEREMTMLETGAAPSPWWASDGPGESSFTETITWSDDSIQSTVDLNTPEPDVCDDHDLDPEDNDDLLDEILNIEIPVSID